MLGLGVVVARGHTYLTIFFYFFNLFILFFVLLPIPDPPRFDFCFLFSDSFLFYLFYFYLNFEFPSRPSRRILRVITYWLQTSLISLFYFLPCPIPEDNSHE